MTRCPETALACLLAECLHVQQTCSLSHGKRPLKAVPDEALIRHETIERTRDWMSGAPV